MLDTPNPVQTIHVIDVVAYGLRVVEFPLDTLDMCLTEYGVFNDLVTAKCSSDPWQ